MLNSEQTPYLQGVTESNVWLKANIQMRQPLLNKAKVLKTETLPVKLKNQLPQLYSINPCKSQLNNGITLHIILHIET